MRTRSPQTLEPTNRASSKPGAIHFALVSVTWATEVTTHSLTTGDTVTEYVPGFLGPSGTSWYLAPVSATEHGFRLVGRCAAGFHTARLPELAGIDAPRQVNVHDFPI
ncbi:MULTISPECIES: hypothetical protein [unclassified Gordonia (in: high G+C Gram-positive bacteria)]|uniref:hypothetical protein n=1 Tax=unclassified Gordonia (in: high G+C Gram-positive bacteria) TaxID=2657482 RepID=UPI0018D30C0B|nr:MULTISPECIES: hypothetical protein [unclassified Gordonia (in: high G+C Gram-positive bacteria)]